MEISKDAVLQLLRDKGLNDHADRAQNELPDQVDTEEHAGLLSKFNLDPQELLGKLGNTGLHF